MTPPCEAIQTAEIVLPSRILGADLNFFTNILGFRIDSIFPADDPSVAVLSGYGLRLRLERGADGPAARIRLQLDGLCALDDCPRLLTAPNGTLIELVDFGQGISLPPLSPAYCVSKLQTDAAWVVGRAGMEYRDLIPQREGGRFIASHIRIRDGGPVPDYVHYHQVRFQVIYCYRGWVRLVYEDQGPEFVMHAGDCVLQPPEIRHRVLECSDGLEVIEIGSPGEHITCADHDLELPTRTHLPDRDFSRQRFVWHQAATARWTSSPRDGFEGRDLGVAKATQGVAAATVLRRCANVSPTHGVHQGEFLFHFVLQGALRLSAEGHEAVELQRGDCFTLPSGLSHCLQNCTDDLELLEIRLPA